MKEPAKAVGQKQKQQQKKNIKNLKSNFKDK